MSQDLFADAPPVMRAWHDYMQTDDPALLDALLADDVVFESPVVHTPQVGKPITTLYLRSAAVVLGNDTFTYDHVWWADRSAVLEFSCEIDGLKVNGADMVFWNDKGQIDHFKVMVRPLKAVNAVHAAMGARLTKAKA